MLHAPTAYDQPHRLIVRCRLSSCSWYWPWSEHWV